ncbi:hypothetical protein OO009_04270 [Flavobacteriaceae bacterium KMM 6897]|nr:hypothetical protein [Flavobacteriaceae bacterium KMM 6897]MEB8345953.1 hypothetical protein [Flavobacteriaceae bacterium KMM 6898]
MKCRSVLFITVLFLSSMALAQTKMEREHRIKKSQFPVNGRLFMETKIGPVKKLRYYREIDSSKIIYTSKFKKDRLHYSIQFSEISEFQKVSITVKEIDIPRDSWAKITSFLEEHFTKYRIKEIRQQYTVTKDQPEAVTLKNAFQNMILPEINYEILTKGKMNGNAQEYKILFDSEGNMVLLKKAVPTNYDHILY